MSDLLFSKFKEDTDVVKQASRYVIAFLAVLCILFSLLLSATFVPKDKIQENYQESVAFLMERPTSFYFHTFVHGSKLDYYADAITLSIGYYLGNTDPLTSSMWCSYYGANSNMMNEYLKESVETEIEPNQEYLRYWHGSAALMRILHLALNIKQIYAFHVVIMIALAAILITMLFRYGYKAEAAAFIISMVVVGVWYVPLCLEYTYSFLCMLVASIVGLRLVLKEKYSWIGPFFLITGMITVYFDFLTTETLSFLVPLLFILRISRRQGKEKALLAVNSCAAWLIGYLGMWLMKWVLATIILGIDVMPYVNEHIAERLNGKVVGYYMTGNFYLDTILKNLQRLFPYEYGLYGAALVMMFAVVIFVLPAVRGKLSVRRKINGFNILLYVCIGLIPYVRYLVLNNHSYVHYFFTYRAQAATVIAISFIFFELFEKSPRKAVRMNV